MKRLHSSRSRLHGVADLLKPADEAVGGLGGVGSVEVGCPEVVPLGAVAQHVPGRGEHRGCNADDGFLGTAASAQSVELRLSQVKVHSVYLQEHILTQ